MRKLALVLVLIMVLASTVGVSASDYDNWQGVFGGEGDTLIDGFDYTEAGGTVVANYVKGKGSFVVKVEAWGLKPFEEYEIVFTKKIEGTWSPMTIGWFTADEYGNGSKTVQGWKEDGFDGNYIEPTAPLSHFNIMHYIDYPDGKSWVASTYYDRTDFPLEAVGSNRGE